ncbi:Uncharacterised protein [Mycobacteroides abscessus subsp. abscessus]|nr:Uncharacterised protein [Mycobacteroides abscessus subsp. abscessus]
MPCHITRLLAALALMITAAVAETPSLPEIGSCCPPRISTLIFRSCGGFGLDPLGHCRQFTSSRAEVRPNNGYCLPQATTSSRTRSGVGRASASLQELTNCPSVSRSALARSTNGPNAPLSGPRAAFNVFARFCTTAVLSPTGYASAVVMARTTVARDQGRPPFCARFSRSPTAPAGSGPSGQLLATHCAANASNADCWPLSRCSAAASAAMSAATGESSRSRATLLGCDPA